MKTFKNRYQPSILAPNYSKPRKVGRAQEIEQMRKENMTQDEIADSLGITRSAVQSYMRKHGIK